MKLICNNCNTTIDEQHINFKEGIANCQKCNEFILIAEYLKGKEEITRIEKPSYSDIELSKDLNGYKFVIPPSGWNSTISFLAFFSLIWNGIIWFHLLSDSFPSQGKEKLFILPFILFGIIILLITIYSISGRSELTIDRANTTVNLLLFGLTYSRSKETNDFSKVNVEQVYTRNDTPVYIIRLYFKVGKKLGFGSKISDDEKRWVMGEINAIMEEYS